MDGGPGDPRGQRDHREEDKGELEDPSVVERRDPGDEGVGLLEDSRVEEQRDSGVRGTGIQRDPGEGGTRGQRLPGLAEHRNPVEGGSRDPREEDKRGLENPRVGEQRDPGEGGEEVPEDPSVEERIEPGEGCAEVPEGAWVGERRDPGEGGTGLLEDHPTVEEWRDPMDEGTGVLEDSLEEIFHDCSQEPEEETLQVLERELSPEERERRREESGMFKEEGNTKFKKGDYVEAENSYSHGLQVCPACYQKERAILFSNRAAARMKQDKQDAAITDCSKAIKLNPNYIRAILRRAELYEKTDKLDEALEDYKCVLEQDPSVQPAREACVRLPKQIEERNEKMKEDMISKLKDLGNLVLRPFGLSTENFQVNQDSSSGSYSINFVQNPNNNNR